MFIECPPPSEEMIRAAAQDIQLPEKTIAALNHVDPFDEKVHNQKRCILLLLIYIPLYTLYTDPIIPQILT